MTQFRQQAINIRTNVFDISRIGGPGDVAFPVFGINTFQQPDMAGGIIPYIYSHPGSIGARLVVLARQHPLNDMLPRSHVFLVW